MASITFFGDARMRGSMTETDRSTPLVNDAPGVRILRSLRQWIGDGRLPPGECLPSENVLAGELGVARATLRVALKRLEDEGLLRARGRRRIVTGEGTTVSNVVSQTVAILVNGPGHTPAKLIGWDQFIQVGIIQAVRDAGLHGLTLEASLLAGDQAQRLISERPRGVIALRNAVQSATGQQFIAALRSAGIPVVGYANENELQGCDTVASDHASGAYQLAKWLIARGRKGILRFWHGPWDADARPAWLSQRDAGFERAMAESGLPILPAVEPPGPRKEGADPEHYIRFSVAYLAEHLVRPGVDAIMLSSDGLVPDVAAALRLLGKEPNRDIDLVGYDHYWADVPEWARAAVPPLATVDKRNIKIGQTLVDLLLARLGGTLPAEPQHRLVEPQLVEHPETTGPMMT
jgi:GntR family transcriptional regulator, arabinose operon transcriptional repressor